MLVCSANIWCVKRVFTYLVSPRDKEVFYWFIKTVQYKLLFNCGNYWLGCTSEHDDKQVVMWQNIIRNNKYNKVEVKSGELEGYDLGETGKKGGIWWIRYPGREKMISPSEGKQNRRKLCFCDGAELSKPCFVPALCFLMFHFLEIDSKSSFFWLIK